MPGIGIINVEELFGIRFIRLEKKIELVVTFKDAADDLEIDRTGLERKTYEILGAQIPIWRFLCAPEGIWPASWKWLRWFRQQEIWDMIPPLTLMKNC